MSGSVAGALTGAAGTAGGSGDGDHDPLGLGRRVECVSVRVF